MLFWILFRYQHFAYHMIFYLLSSKTQFLVYICLNCTCRLWHCDYFYDMYFLNCSYSFLSYLYLLPYSSLFPFPFPSRALFRAHQIVQKEINLTKIAHSLVDQPNFWSIKAIYFYVPTHVTAFDSHSYLDCRSLEVLHITNGGFILHFIIREYNREVSQSEEKYVVSWCK